LNSPQIGRTALKHMGKFLSTKNISMLASPTYIHRRGNIAITSTDIPWEIERPGE
jgi:hypothetical protein